MNTSPMKVMVSCPFNGRKKQGSKKWLTQSYSQVWFEPKFISSPLPPVTFSGYFLSGFVQGVNLGKVQIIRSRLHSLLWSLFSSRFFWKEGWPPGNRGCGSHFSGTQLLDNPVPWVPRGCSIDSQQWTKRLSSSGLPQMKLYSCLGTCPGRKSPSDNRNALDINEQMPHLWFVSFAKKPMLISPITSMHVFSPPRQNGMESKPESLKNFYWPCLSFTLAP